MEQKFNVVFAGKNLNQIPLTKKQAVVLHNSIVMNYGHECEILPDTKDHIINGVIVAKYMVDGETLYLKILNEVNGEGFEDIVVNDIQVSQNKTFSFLAYLNI
jgi:hypothetical protein